MARQHHRGVDVVQAVGGCERLCWIGVEHWVQHLGPAGPAQRMAADEGITDRYGAGFGKQDRDIARGVPRQQNGLRLTGKLLQRVGAPGPGIRCRLRLEGSRLDGMGHPTEHAGPPCADDDLAQGDLVLSVPWTWASSSGAHRMGVPYVSEK